jgi:hypothetical integral membrane protein (TIGR02206 family)
MSGPEFQLFGTWHWAILATVPAAGALLTWLASMTGRARLIGRAAGLLLITNELVWYAWRLREEGFRFPEALPLQLCDVSLWLTAITALTLKPGLYDVAWYWGVAGTTMAVLTPDLWAPLCSYPTIYFFCAHGGVIATLLLLAWTHTARPRPGSWWKALAILNGYAAMVGCFDWLFGTNYMFLCQRPESASLLDYMGPWPVYLLTGEAVAAALFRLLWQPFRTAAS